MSAAEKVEEGAAAGGGEGSGGSSVQEAQTLAEGPKAPPAAAPAPPARRIRCTPKAEMLEPRVASGAPVRLHLVAEKEGGGGADAGCECGRQHLVQGGEYAYCTCGLAATQPLCDGACEGTRFVPLPFRVTKEQSTLLLCACKRTQDPPFCDGRHVHIGWDDLQW